MRLAVKSMSVTLRVSPVPDDERCPESWVRCGVVLRVVEQLQHNELSEWPA